MTRDASFGPFFIVVGGNGGDHHSIVPIHNVSKVNKKKHIKKNTPRARDASS